MLLAVAGSSVSFITIGDWGDTALPGQARVAAAMETWAEQWLPEFVVSTGDTFYPWGQYTLELAMPNLLSWQISVLKENLAS